MEHVRDIVIGDVHGCIDELNELLVLVSYSPRTDRLVIAGDLVDKGPDSAAVVRRVRELGAESVMGNHDEWYARFHRRLTDGECKMRRTPDREKIYRSLSREDLEWMQAMPKFIRLDERTVVVHAGFRKSVPVEEQDFDDCLHLRYVRRESGERWNMASVTLLTPDVAAFWTEVWAGPEDVVYGHHPSKSETVLTECAGARCWGIDTGCCFGNKLTAWVRTGAGVELVSVSARAQYSSWHRSMQEG